MSDIEKVQERLTKLAEELRGSSFPVSVFFLVTSTESIALMVQRLHALIAFGATSKQINSIAEAVAKALDRDLPAASPPIQCELTLQVNDEVRTGDVCYLRNIPGTGVEVELLLPGIITSTAVGFIDNSSGFWTAYMPPSFYR